MSAAIRARALLAPAVMLAVVLVTAPATAQDHAHHPTPAAGGSSQHDHAVAPAFPAAHGRAMRDNAIHSLLVLDRLEGWQADGAAVLGWSGHGWIGTDLDRLWLRSSGRRGAGRVQAAHIEALYGRSIAAWWDVVAGVRRELRPGPQRTFAAVGIQGLAPQRIGVEATAYLGEHGHAAAHLELEYELLLTNRLILQPLLALELRARDDPARGIGAGLASAEGGLRLRYEITRRFAPYAGLAHERSFGRTAELRRMASGPVRDTHFVLGLRLWF